MSAKIWDGHLRIAGFLVVALLGVVGCGDTVRRTALPNGYAVETMGRRYGIVIRPDGPTSSSWTPIWPELVPANDREYCGPFGWTNNWVVCRVVTYERSERQMTDEYMVLDTESGAVSMVATVGQLREFFRLKGVPVPTLSDEHSEEFVLSW